MSCHFGRQHDFVNQNKSLDDFSDRLICSVEYNAGVFSDATRHTQEVLIAGYDHPSFSSRKLEMVFIIIRSQAGFVRRGYVNASTTKAIAIAGSTCSSKWKRMRSAMGERVQLFSQT